MFNVIPSLKSDRVLSRPITINELISKITTCNDQVTIAREHGKGSTVYDQIKRNSIEAYYPNCFEGSPTGYLYADMDNFNSIDHAISYKDYLKTLPFIALCWLSLSNKGLSILVKVDSLNADNYTEYWNKLNEVLDSRLDSHSKGFNKVNCISYDPALYVNDNPISFDSIHNIGFNKKGLSGTIFKHNIISTTETFLDNPDQVQVGLTYRTYLPDSDYTSIDIPVVIPEGKQILEINLVQYKNNKIPKGNRNATIGAISMQLIVLNPLAKKIQILNALQSINRNYCSTPLQVQEVRDIFNANYNKYLKEGLDVTPYLKRKYIFWHKLCVMPSVDKQSIGNRLFLKARGKGKEYTESLINDCIENLQDGKKITHQRVSEYTGLTVKKIKRYWKPFKTLVKEYNQKLK